MYNFIEHNCNKERRQKAYDKRPKNILNGIPQKRQKLCVCHYVYVIIKFAETLRGISSHIKKRPKGSKHGWTPHKNINYEQHWQHKKPRTGIFTKAHSFLCAFGQNLIPHFANSLSFKCRRNGLSRSAEPKINILPCQDSSSGSQTQHS